MSPRFSKVVLGVLVAVTSLFANVSRALTIVDYNAGSGRLEGNMPFTQTITKEVYIESDEITGPTPVTFVAVPTSLPVGFTAAQAAAFISFSPVTYTPGDIKNVFQVTGTFPKLDVPPGTQLVFQYQVFTSGLPGTSPLSDQGFGLNATVTAPPPADNQPPTISIGEPALPVYHFHAAELASGATVPLAFTAYTLKAKPIINMDATYDGPGVIPANGGVSLTLGTPVYSTGVDGSGNTVEIESRTATGAMVVPRAGTYNVMTRASNGVGDGGSASASFVVVVDDGPVPTVVVSQPVLEAEYTYYDGGSPVHIPAAFDATVAAIAPLEKWSATLTKPSSSTSYPISPAIPGNETISGTDNVSHGTTTMDLTESGHYTLSVKAENQYGDGTGQTTFWVNKVINPQDVTVPAFQNATFQVTVTGQPSYTYQWVRQAAGTTVYIPLVNDATYSGVTTSTLAITSARGGMSGDKFKCLITAANRLLPVSSGAATLTVLKLNPTITWSPTGFVYGTALSGAQLNATSATAGSFAYSPAAGVVLAAGTRTLATTLTPTDTENYNSASAVRDIVISKAVVDVRANAATKVYGAAVPTLTYALDAADFVNGDTAAVVSGTAVLSTTADVNSVPALYTIGIGVGSLTAANYTFNLIDATLTVTKAELTLTASAASRIYGDANPAFTFTGSGFVGTDSQSNSLTGTASLTTTGTTGSAVGTYPITFGLGTLASTKYTLKLVDGLLTVTPASLTVKANNASMTAGDALPNFTANYSGFVNGDSVATAFSVLPTLSTTTTGSLPGTFAIIVSGGVASNYTLNRVNGVLTVAPAQPQKVTLAGQVYFDVNVSHQFETGEPGIGGISIELRNANNQVVGTPSTTSPDGSYAISVDPQATYYLTFGVPPGLTPSTSTELKVIVGASNISSLDVGLALDLERMRSMRADGNTIGYWKNNLSKAAAGRATGTQEMLAGLVAYTNNIRTYALSPFNTEISAVSVSPLAVAGLNQAAAILGSTSSDPAALLKKQLLGSEYNFARGSNIDGNGTLTSLFIYWGEYVLLNAGRYGSTYVLWAKDWFDAYNNSHGQTVAGPAPLGGTSIAADFNGTAINAGSTIWFNAVVNVSGRSNTVATVEFTRANVDLSVGGVPVSVDLPDTVIRFDPAVITSSAEYDDATDTWYVTVPAGYSGNVLVGAKAVPVPVSLPGGIKSVTWNGRFTSTTPNLTATWKWAAAVYTRFDDNDAVGTKAVDGSKFTLWANSDFAGTPELFKSWVTGGARGGGGSNWTGSYSGTAKISIPLP